MKETRYTYISRFYNQEAEVSLTMGTTFVESLASTAPPTSTPNSDEARYITLSTGSGLVARKIVVPLDALCWSLCSSGTFRWCSEFSRNPPRSHERYNRDQSGWPLKGL